MKTCLICNKKLNGRQRKYCSKACKNNDINHKHNSYVKQCERGLKRKKYLVSLHGGKCSICGYSKNYSALAFHHQDPNEKDQGLDLRKLSNSTLEWCVKESNKCVLLCMNCHSEVHHPQLKI